jgi:hypothetical protein
MTNKNKLLSFTALALLLAAPAFANDLGTSAVVTTSPARVTTTTVINDDGSERVITTRPVAASTRTQRTVTTYTSTPDAPDADADAWVLGGDEDYMPRGYVVVPETSSGAYSLVDVNRDGLISSNEFVTDTSDMRLFKRIDADHNGRLSHAEIDNYNNNHDQKFAIVLPTTKKVRTYSNVETTVIE